MHSATGDDLTPNGYVGPPEQLHGNLDVWAWSIAAGSLEKLTPSFNERYPNVQVSVNMTGANTTILRLMLSLSSGMGAPDVSQIEIINAPRYVLTGRLADLTPVASQYAEQFVPASWGNCLLDGRVYAIPWDVGPCAVYYKRHLFARYGVDPSTIETWDDYIDAGKLIVERSGGETKMLALPATYVPTMFEILIQQNGGQIFDDRGRVAIDSPESRQVMKVLEAMLTEGITANTAMFGQSFMASFGTDAVATYPMAAWFGGFIKDNAPGTSGDWGLFRLPALEPGGLRTSTNGGSVLIVPDQCTQKDAVWAFVQYMLCTEEVQIAHYRNFDLFPALLSTYDNPFFDEPDAFFGGQNVRRLFAEDITKIPVLNRTKDWRETLRYMSQQMSEWAANGCQGTNEMLTELAHRLSQRLRRDLAPGPTGASS